jgi:hypothetical protein
MTAAAIEAFWSSAAWIAPGVKYGVGACCWALVMAWLALQGRGRAPREPRHGTSTAAAIVDAASDVGPARR